MGLDGPGESRTAVGQGVGVLINEPLGYL